MTLPGGICQDPAISAPGQGSVEHTRIQAKALDSPQVSPPGGPCTRVVGRHPGFLVLGLATCDLSFLERREGGCRPEGGQG